ncbi:DUF3795 domain-containing protein [Ruminococcaceae bacterium OttesenSCG-928-A16]|nr:DUF3795 domain-containing protein [Ruminococcaceae bacterium OttesenSCG-928-A16]
MKEYSREYPLFSLCGLNCGLCPNFEENTSAEAAFKCPGCGGAAFYQKHPTCAIVSCALRHGGVQYCNLCNEYPCARYNTREPYDSFITYRHVRQDFAKAKGAGFAAYKVDLEEKMRLLQTLLQNYNDGRRKSFFCTAVNLLQPEELKTVLKELAQQTKPESTLKEKATFATSLLNQAGEKSGVDLKLRKKK